MSSGAVFLSTPRTRYKDSPDVESERCLCCSAITRTHTHTPSPLTSHNHLLSLKEKEERCACYKCCMRLYVCHSAFLLPLLFGFFLFTKQQKIKVCTCCQPRNVAITLFSFQIILLLYTQFFAFYYPLAQQNTEYHHYYVSQS